MIAVCAADPRYAVAVYYVDVSPTTVKTRMTAGVPVYYGSPTRSYEILGGNLAPIHNGQLAEYVAQRAKNAGGDAVIVLRPSPKCDGGALLQEIRFKH